MLHLRDMHPVSHLRPCEPCGHLRCILVRHLTDTETSKNLELVSAELTLLDLLPATAVTYPCMRAPLQANDSVCVHFEGCDRVVRALERSRVPHLDTAILST
jgi:hypothetical protein